jgi:transposase InsO family protein
MGKPRFVRAVIEEQESVGERQRDPLGDFGSSRPILMAEPTVFVDLRVNGRTLAAVVDTGAMVSVLGEGAYNKDVDGGLTATQLHLHGANGSALELMGEVSAELALGPVTQQWSLPVVRGLGYQCLLGADFLSRLGARLDFTNYTLQFGKSVVKMRKQSTGSVVCPVSDQPVVGGPDRLSEGQRQQLRELLAKYEHVFSSPSRPLGKAKLPPLRIDTGTATPIASRPYRLSATEREEVNAEVQKLLSRGIIRPSMSSWASPCIIVKRSPQDKPRMCIDYRRLNVSIQADAYPLPRLDDCIEKLGGAKYISTLDLASAYHQCPIAEEDQHKSAFVTAEGLWEFLVVPFGIKTAPGYFQRSIDRTMAGIPHTVVFLDDICIATPTFEKHLEVLEMVLQRLAQVDLLLSKEKCFLLKDHLSFLGHRVSAAGVEPDPAKLAAIDQVVAPKNVDQVRAFLGLVGFYRRFVPDFARIAEPITKLLRKETEFIWDREQELAFQTLKAKLMTAPILRFPDFNRKFRVQTDASGVGIGAVLAQDDDDGNEHPVAYISRALSPAESRYSVTEQECLAIVWALKKFRPYVYGKNFEIITDHWALKWLRSLKNPVGRLARWMLDIQEYDFAVVHRPGKLNGAADGLSRLLAVTRSHTREVMAGAEAEEEMAPVAPVDDAPEEPAIEEEVVIHTTAPTDTPASTDNPASDEVILEKLTIPSMVEYQQQDDWCTAVKTYLTANQEPDYSTMGLNKPSFLATAEQSFVSDDGVLCCWVPGDAKNPRVLVPKAVQDEVLAACHDHAWAGHLGFARTLQRAQRYCYWPTMRKDTMAYVSKCVACSRRQGQESERGLPLGHVQAAHPLEVVAMDVLGPLPETDHGNKYLLVISDYFTRFVVACALPNQQAATVVTAFLNQFVNVFGVPKKLLTDNGTNFRSTLMKEVLRLLGVHKLWTTPYHPQCDGMVERWNRTACDMISKYVDVQQRNWDRYVGLVTHAYNSSYHPTVMNLPHFLMFGRNPQSVFDRIMPDAAESSPDIFVGLEEAQMELRRTFTALKDRRDVVNAERRGLRKYGVGDRVWLYYPRVAQGLTAKLGRRWKGPYLVTKTFPPVNYLIVPADGGPGQVVHAARLKAYNENKAEEPETMPPDAEEPETPFDEVEDVCYVPRPY